VFDDEDCLDVSTESAEGGPEPFAGNWLHQVIRNPEILRERPIRAPSAEDYWDLVPMGVRPRQLTPTIARRLGSHNHRPEGTTARPFRCAQVGEGEHAIPVEVALEDANRLVRVVDDQNAAFSLASNPARQPLVPGGAGRFGGGLLGSHRKAKEEACPLS